MFENVTPSENRNRICPYLGQKEDPKTALAFPSSLNYCHHGRPGFPVKLNHQNSFCLHFGHEQCEVYQSEPGLSLPIQLRNTIHGSKNQARKRATLTLAAILIALTLIIAFWVLVLILPGIKQEGEKATKVLSLPATITVTQTHTVTSVAPSPTLTMTKTVRLTSTLTVTPTWTLTPTRYYFRNLETPMGPANQFVIHRVRTGESLILLAREYNTTVEAITAINYHLSSPLLIDWLVIIPVDRTDVTGLPVFKAYQVIEAISTDDLVKSLSINGEEFKYYNGLTGSQELKSGEWVLVPYNSTATP